jgi:Transcriptional repressor TCF25
MRSFSLWKPPERAAWLFKTLNPLSASSFATSEPPHPRGRIQNLFSEPSNISDAIYRHVVVVSPLAPDFRRLTAFLPSEVTTRLTRTIEGDPLPPVTAVSIYEGAYFSDAAHVNRRGGTRNVIGNRVANQPQGLNIPDQLRVRSKVSNPRIWLGSVVEKPICRLCLICIRRFWQDSVRVLTLTC